LDWNKPALTSFVPDVIVQLPQGVVELQSQGAAWACARSDTLRTETTIGAIETANEYLMLSPLSP
jgi:hypothetical protein